MSRPDGYYFWTVFGGAALDSVFAHDLHAAALAGRPQVRDFLSGRGIHVAAGDELGHLLLVFRTRWSAVAPVLAKLARIPGFVLVPATFDPAAALGLAVPDQKYRGSVIAEAKNGTLPPRLKQGLVSNGETYPKFDLGVHGGALQNLLGETTFGLQLENYRLLGWRTLVRLQRGEDAADWLKIGAIRCGFSASLAPTEPFLLASALLEFLQDAEGGAVATLRQTLARSRRRDDAVARDLVTDLVSALEAGSILVRGELPAGPRGTEAADRAAAKPSARKRAGNAVPRRRSRPSQKPKAKKKARTKKKTPPRTSRRPARRRR